MHVHVYVHWYDKILLCIIVAVLCSLCVAKTRGVGYMLSHAASVAISWAGRSIARHCPLLASVL